MPFTLDLSTTLYFHNYRNGLLLGISNRDEEPGLCREFSYGWTRAFDEAAAVVAPTLADQPLVGGWAGLYENTPDHNAMIGRPTVPGVFYATGFSGHGFLQGPAVGEIIRDLYLDREPFLDPRPFSADRFGDADHCSTRSTSSDHPTRREVVDGDQDDGSTTEFANSARVPMSTNSPIAPGTAALLGSWTVSTSAPSTVTGTPDVSTTSVRWTHPSGPMSALASYGDRPRSSRWRTQPG